MKQEYKTVIKSMVYAQCFVDTLDQFKGTNQFKQQLKRKANMFNEEVERFLNNTYANGSTDTNIIHLMDECEKAIDNVIDNQVEVVE